MVRLAVVATFLIVTLGSWALMKPPAPGFERLANGVVITEDGATDAVEVTRSAPADPMLPAIATMPSDARLLTATLDAILDGLGFGAGEVGADELREMTSGALSGIGAVTGTETSVEPLPLADIVVAAITARKDDRAIAAEIEAGFAATELAVPAALITTQGRVDTPALLASIVTGAKARLGEELPLPVTQVATYTVAEGDSLAAISMEIYGDINAWTVLWEANDDLLPNPAQIEAGMQLLVPPM